MKKQFLDGPESVFLLLAIVVYLIIRKDKKYEKR